jgi:hypothetical protein
MNIFVDEHRAIILQLLKANVDFMLVGGYAVIYHGYGRTTGDIDIWLNPNNENRDRLIPIIATMGIMSEDIEKLKKTDFKEMVAFHIGEQPERIDFITRLSGLQYNEANKNKVFLALEGYQVPVIHLDDLVLTKLVSNRAKDKADVEELQKIMQLKKKS